jgi:hypothetical protein
MDIADRQPIPGSARSKVSKTKAMAAADAKRSATRKGDFKMTITKKLELADRLKREMDSAIETLTKRDGLTRAAAVDRVILSPEVSRGHREEREETEREERLHDRVSKDAIKTRRGDRCPC